MMKRVFSLTCAVLVAIPILADKDDADKIREDALQLLTSGEKGIQAFNRWREATPQLSLNLSRIDLRGVDLREANLSSVDLSEANLAGAKLWRSYFYRANLRGANLAGVSFNGADFRGATYVYATMNRPLLDEIESQNRRTVILVK